MDRDTAKYEIQRRAKELLQPDNSKQGFICPICGSGSGKKGTGITTKDGIHFTCWAGCFSNADIIDIIGLEQGLTEYRDKLTAAARELNIDIDSYSSAKEDFKQYQNQDKTEQHTQSNIHNTAYTIRATEEEAEPDYTGFFLQANKDIEKTSYHRGLSLDTLNRFKIGYVESWKHPKAPQAPASPRLIIPTSKHSYLARDTREQLTDAQKQYSKSKVGKVRVFNSKSIATAAQPVFIVEGEIDAMSIVEVGGEAVGLGSLGNVSKLLNMLEQSKPQHPFIICLDNDDNQKAKDNVAKALNKLRDGLKRLNIAFFEEDIAKPYKDANEALQADRAAFTAAVSEAIHRAEITDEERKEQLKAELEKEAVAYWLPNFIKNIEESKTAAYIPTGFLAVDEALDGGLYAGLYIVGAISSLGKTTFCLQIADQIAQAGNDVLIFSLEMARNELIAKSVSRLTLLQDIDTNSTTKNAKTTRGILTGSRYKYYSEKEQQLIQGAITRYAEYGTNIYITEGIGNVGIAEVREKVEKHIEITGKAPVVLIDYLQILAPADIRATDKQNTDKAVLELKRLSRDYSIPVIGISSFNRDNYTAPVNLASFKESGAIEYSSDVLIGLQYEGMDYQEGEAETARNKRLRGLMKQVIEDGKAGRPQKIQVKILKNRNGSKGEALLDFYPMFNYFTDKDSITDIKDGEGANNEWSSSESTYE